MANETTTPVQAATSTPAPAPAAPVPAAAPVTPASTAVATPAPAAIAAAPATPKPEEPATTVAKPEGEKKAEEPGSLLKPPAEKKADTEPGDKAKAAPAEVEVKVPEGVKVNGALVDEFKGLAKEAGLDSTNAQKVFDLGLKMQKSFVEDMDRQLEQYKVDSISSLRKEWGPQFDQNVLAAQKVIDKFGDAKLLEELNGMENAPSVMRTLAAIGRAMGEDSIAIPGARSAPAPKKGQTGNALIDSMADGLYPLMNKDS
jgi:hypothetical protein